MMNQNAAPVSMDLVGGIVPEGAQAGATAIDMGRDRAVRYLWRAVPRQAVGGPGRPEGRHTCVSSPWPSGIKAWCGDVEVLNFPEEEVRYRMRARLVCGLETLGLRRVQHLR